MQLLTESTLNAAIEFAAAIPDVSIGIFLDTETSARATENNILDDRCPEINRIMGVRGNTLVFDNGSTIKCIGLHTATEHRGLRFNIILVHVLVPAEQRGVLLRYEIPSHGHPDFMVVFDEGSGQYFKMHTRVDDPFAIPITEINVDNYISTDNWNIRFENGLIIEANCNVDLGEITATKELTDYIDNITECEMDSR